MSLKGGLRFACGYKSNKGALANFTTWILTTKPTVRNT